MKALWERLPPLHPLARDVALTGLRVAVLLSFCTALLLGLGGPRGIDTYYIFQNAEAMQDVLRSVLLITAIGTAWIQTLFRKK